MKCDFPYAARLHGFVRQAGRDKLPRTAALPARAHAGCRHFVRSWRDGARPRWLYACLLSACLPGIATPALAAPYTPASGSEVVATLPRRADAQWQALQAQRTQLAAEPRNAALAADLAQRYILLGRTQADPRHYGHAQAALAPWWHDAAPPPAIRLLRATLLQNGHHYREALSDLDALTRQQPGNAQAWLTRATVLAVIGEHAQAAASCARLASLADELATAACLAGAAAPAPQQAAAERLLGLALARTGAVPPDELAWGLTLWAELAMRRGDAVAAATRYRTALASAPGDQYLLGAYADFLLDRGQPSAALALVDSHARSDALLLRRALALKQLGQSERLRADLAELAARFDAAQRRGDRVHQREQARYTLHLLGDARAALALARDNWDVQKEPADARILLEAALAAHDTAAAQPVLQWLAHSGLHDAVLAALATQLRRQT